MAGPGPKGSRVDYGQKGGASKDMRTGDNPTPSSVSGATNAKVAISGVKNHNTSKTSAAKPTTRKTTGSE